MISRLLLVLVLAAPVLADGWFSPSHADRLVEKGWRPALYQRGASTLTVTAITLEGGAPLQLGDRKAFLHAEEGAISLPEIGLQYNIEPKTEVDRLAAELAGDEGAAQQVGVSVEGRPIMLSMLGGGEEAVLFLGAFHGDEPESAELLRRFVSYLQENPQLLEGRMAVFVPVVNPDGLERGLRKNAREVDLNRNFPTSNWNSEGRDTDYWGGPEPASEPETRMVVALIERFQPARIISVHCPYRCVNYDGPAEALAEAMAAANGYKVEPSIGYPTPGSFGTYAGIEGGIPTITLELPPTGEEDVWNDNRAALIRALRGVE